MHEKYMKRCLELAKSGLGKTLSNPLVGCVITYENRIIGEGYHRKFGEAHAEVNAINSVKNKALLTKSTLYVNLEPCSHYGKTPPCADLIIKHNIPQVIIGCIDIFSKVAGRGVRKLKNNACNVTVGMLENECVELNKRFFTYHKKKRPYIILKWAETIDGYIDIERSKDSPVEPHWITDKQARTLVHKWRADEMAIMVGTQTVKMDNPKLSVRDWSGRHPARIVIDRYLSLSPDFAVFDKTIPTIIFTEKQKQSEPNLEFININFSKEYGDTLKQILDVLYDKKIVSVIIEGGAKLLNSFISAKKWDEARVFIGKKYFKRGKTAPKLFQAADDIIPVNENMLLWYKNPENSLQ